MADASERSWLGVPEWVIDKLLKTALVFLAAYYGNGIHSAIQTNGTQQVQHATELKAEVAEVKNAALSNVAVSRRVEAGVKAISEAAASAAAKVVEEKQAAQAAPEGI